MIGFKPLAAGPIASGPVGPTTPIPIHHGHQLDAGHMTHFINVDYGPSIGEMLTIILPTVYITDPGEYFIAFNVGVIIVDAAGVVQIDLPDVRDWLNQYQYSPVTGFSRSVWIKDIGGNLSTFNLTIMPSPGQFIDGQPFTTMVNDRGLARVYPLEDQTGWFIG